MLLKLLLALVISFVVSSGFGYFYIPWLRAQHAGQRIKKNGPVWHEQKNGTPTMGGVMFILGILAACFALSFSLPNEDRLRISFVFLFALGFGAIGFLDDWEKIRHKENLGLSGWMKFALQVVLSLVFVYFMRKSGIASHGESQPYFIVSADSVPLWLYYICAVFIITGTVNAVNITDGVDGLATGTSLPVFLFFVALCFLSQGKFGEQYLPEGIFSSAVIGGLFGFLIYNFNPAKVFMGDTGSLFLGGAIAAMAFAYNMPLILVILAFVFLVETLSDIIQVAYFKLTHGKRIFKMAPFHHHLEMGGWTGKKWKERELFCLFTGVSLLCAIISFILVYKRFI